MTRHTMKRNLVALGASAALLTFGGAAALANGSNGGDVTQRNDSTAGAEALNNETEQTINQGSAGKGGGTNSASQSSSNSQILPVSIGAGVSAPVNANVPVAVLSNGSNGGDVDQRNRSKATGRAVNVEQDQDITQRSGSGGTNSASQSASNSQILPLALGLGLSAPVNANVPVAVLSNGSNGGKVKQRNDSTARAEALNNETEQTIRQGGSKSSGGNNSATQSSDTSQIIALALAPALSLPLNPNVPVSVLSDGSNGGDVDQFGDSNAYAEALNNETDQSIRQDDSQTAVSKMLSNVANVLTEGSATQLLGGL